MHNINKKNIKNIKYIPAAKRQAAKTLGKEATQIKYSVIIPVFNSEKYIEKCVCSLLQSAPIENTEIILVNDGSKDKAQKFANAWRLSTIALNISTKSTAVQHRHEMQGLSRQRANLFCFAIPMIMCGPIISQKQSFSEMKI